MYNSDGAQEGEAVKTPYTIAIDAMGGDNAPGAICQGALSALSAFPDVVIRLYGRAEAMKPFLPAERERLTVVDAPDVIGMHDSPMLAVRRMTASSMVMAMLSLKSGESQAFLSAGSTGALLAGGMTRVGRIPGIERPALAPVLPGLRKPFLLIDSGANVDCQSAYLNQFGLMGAVYAERVLGVKDPGVGLLNIGSEPEKGSKLYKEAHALMAAQARYRFVGNVEARDVPTGDADVIVADGFDGNVILKYTEGLSSAIMAAMKAEMTAKARYKIGGLLVRPAMRAFKRRFDFEAYGGAPLLGVNGAMIKSHGSSGAGAIASCVRQARAMIEQNVTGTIRDGLRDIQNAEGDADGI